MKMINLVDSYDNTFTENKPNEIYKRKNLQISKETHEMLGVLW